MIDRNIRIESHANGLLKFTESTSELYTQQFQGLSTYSITEGKIIIISMIKQVLYEDIVDVDSKLIFEKLKNYFIKSLSPLDKGEIESHTNSIDDFLNERIFLYTNEFENLNLNKGEIPMLASYCIFKSPLGKIEMSLKNNKIAFYHKYHIDDLEKVFKLNVLNALLFSNIQNRIVDIFKMF